MSSPDSADWTFSVTILGNSWHDGEKQKPEPGLGCDSSHCLVSPYAWCRVRSRLSIIFQSSSLAVLPKARMATAVTSNAKPPTEDSQAKDSNPTGHVTSKPGPASGPMPQYTAFSLGRQRFILGIVTAAGFFGPLAGGIYLPALPTLQEAFNASATAINATVSVFMGVLAVAVSIPCSIGSPAIARVAGKNPHYSTVMLNIQILSLAPSVVKHANSHSSHSSGVLKRTMAVASLYTWSR